MLYPETPFRGFQLFRGRDLYQRYRIPLIALGLVSLLLTAGWLLWPGISGPFLFDDFPNLENLEHLDGYLSRRSVGVYLSLFEGVPGRPLAALSFLLNDVAWPSDADTFKYTNLLIHLLNGVLVFGLARSLCRAGKVEKTNIVALIATAIWLLNPIQISAIFLTVQRMTELSGLFVFAGLWAYVALAQRASDAVGAFAAITVLGMATILAVLCKENGALAPLFALVINGTVLRETLQRAPALPRRVLRGLVWLAVAMLLIALASQLPKQLGYYSVREFTVYERLLTEGRVVATYLGLILVPRLSSSGLYNDDFLISRGWLDPTTTLMCWALLAAALCIAFWQRKHQPWLAFGALWYFAGHITESTVFPLELYFEHRNYMPLFGPALAIAVGIASINGKLMWPLRLGLLVWLVLSAGILHMQAKVWGNWALLSTIWQAEHPTSLRAQQQYADFLYRTGQHDAAYRVFEQANSHGISPVNSQLQLIVLDCMANRRVSPERLSNVERLLRIENVNQGTSGILTSMRQSLALGECAQDISPAQWLKMSQLALNNRSAGGLQRMLHMERAYYFVEAGNLDAANAELEATWARAPEPRVAFYAAATMASSGRFELARNWARRPLHEGGSRWKNWLAMTDDQAKRMLKAIDQGEAEARAGQRSGLSTPNVDK